MPPRGRPKVGWRREDAAMDAMKALGFPPRLVMQKLRELLDIYGKEGWVFIEEASYKLLIEVILEADENKEHGESPTKLLTNGDVAGSSAAAALAGTPHNGHVNVSESPFGVPAFMDAPHNEHLDLADGPNESPVALSSNAEFNKETGDGGTYSYSKETIVGDHARYAGAAHLQSPGEVVPGVAIPSGTGQANIILESVRPKAAGTSGVGNLDEAPRMGCGSVPMAADNFATQPGTDVETSKSHPEQSCDQTIKSEQKSAYGWFDGNFDEDIIDFTNLSSTELANELSGGKKRWDLKPYIKQS